MSEITQPTPESVPVRIEPEVAAGAAIVGRGGSQSSIESPSFAPKIISTEPLAHQPATPVTMAETDPNHTNSTFEKCGDPAPRRRPKFDRRRTRLRNRKRAVDR
jgi:hypothetical protein